MTAPNENSFPLSPSPYRLVTTVGCFVGAFGLLVGF